VQVLLLRWEQDDLDVETELADLKNVFENYGFRTTKWTIPSEDAHSKLMRRVLEFADAYGRKDCLMIVYYGGHAFINEARQTTWAWYVVGISIANQPSSTQKISRTDFF
jgi:hypothetical protein